jgi:polyhydroxybutyrate depolymerase
MCRAIGPAEELVLRAGTAQVVLVAASRLRGVLAVLVVLGVLASSAAVVNFAATVNFPAEASETAAVPAWALTSCGSGDRPGTFSLTLPAGGVQRTVIVHVPLGYRSGAAEPLVLNLHGSGSTAAGQRAATEMDATADQHRFIVAYPQGAIRYGKGYAWNVPGVPLAGGKNPPSHAADDVAFLTGLVAQLGQRYCLDPSRVYAAGFSGGARMASDLGCVATGHPAVFAAIAPVSGLRIASSCQSAAPTAVIAIHGTADRSNPYLGGGQRYWNYSVPVAENRWASHDRCAPRPAVTQLSASVVLRSFDGCAKRSAVELVSISGWGHAWPIVENAAIWAFFQAHPRS